MGVSLHSKTPALFMKYSNGTSTQCNPYQLVSCAFSTILIILFIYLSQIACLLHDPFPANLKLNVLMYGENTICRLMYIEY